jgi:hypothetical protein
VRLRIPMFRLPADNIHFLTDSNSPERPNFVHPVEEVFARILDFYGIVWQYEPRTFPLEWDDAGNVIIAFSPDFFLAEQNLYVELTVLRPKLTKKKNWKLRKMHELYPDVNIKLFKRRELRNMMVRFGLTEEAEKIFGSEAQEWGE